MLHVSVVNKSKIFHLNLLCCIWMRILRLICPQNWSYNYKWQWMCCLWFSVWSSTCDSVRGVWCCYWLSWGRCLKPNCSKLSTFQSNISFIDKFKFFPKGQNLVSPVMYAHLTNMLKHLANGKIAVIMEVCSSSSSSTCNCNSIFDSNQAMKDRKLP